MIIVLKSADFSGNYVEQIQLDVPVHEETETIAARYTGITDSTKANLNVFIDTLLNAGIYSKLKYLMLPLVANNVADALQNALSGSAVGSTGNATMSSRGVTFTSAGFLSLDPVISSSATAFSYGCAIADVATPASSSSERVFTLNSATAVASQFPRAYLDINGSGVVTKYIKAANETSAASQFINDIAIQSVSSGILTYLSTESSVGTYTLESTPSIDALKLSGANSSGYHQYLHSKAIRLLFIADALTSEQMLTLYTAIKTFIEAEV